MVQRSAGLVVSTESLLTHALEGTYSETMIEKGIDHEAMDLIATATPYRLLEVTSVAAISATAISVTDVNVLPQDKWKALTVAMRKTDEQLHAGLSAAGFQLDFGTDLTGVYGKSFRQVGTGYIDASTLYPLPLTATPCPLTLCCQGGGFYIDVGASQLIASGRVGLASGGVSHLDAEVRIS